MKKIFSIALALVMIFTMTGCQDWFDINTSLDNPVSVTCEVVLPTLLFFSVQETFDNAEYGNYLSQCLTTTGRSQTADYSYRAGWGGFLDMNRHPHWRRHFYDIGVNAQYLIDDATKTNKRNYILIAQTLQLHSLLITTDEFGEMPLYEAYQSNVPAYDDQQVIYDSIGRMFDLVLARYADPEWVECPTNGTISIDQDRMFGGDMKKWELFTKALYVRYLTRNIPNMNNTKEIRDKIIDLVDKITTDPDWTEPTYKFDGGTGEKCCQWGPTFSTSATMNLGWPQGRDNGLGAAVPSKFLASILGIYPQQLSLNARKVTDLPSAQYALDPRAERMMAPRQGYNGAPMALRNLRSNIGADVAYGSSYKSEHFPDLFCTTTTPAHTNPFTRDDGYVSFMLLEELLFDKAEAQYWNGNTTDAYNTTKEAIDVSMKRYSVYENMPEAKDYLLDLFYKERMPADGSFSISELMQQRFVALYLQAEEWCDVRRYNYSSSANGIAYDGHYVYDVRNCHDGKTVAITEDRFSGSYTLVRPYNLYTPHWMTSKDLGTNYTLSANAWINRMCPDPETEDKYNRAELERLGAYKNPDYLRKRMIWQRPTNDGGALTSKGDGDWM